jgi:hypothetical protein
MLLINLPPEGNFSDKALAKFVNVHAKELRVYCIDSNLDKIGID